MWLVTCEDSEGMWWDDPIAADTEDEARKIAVQEWARAPSGVALILYKCEAKGEIDRPVVPNKVTAQDVRGILKRD